MARGREGYETGYGSNRAPGAIVEGAQSLAAKTSRILRQHIRCIKIDADCNYLQAASIAAKSSGLAMNAANASPRDFAAAFSIRAVVRLGAKGSPPFW